MKQPITQTLIKPAVQSKTRIAVEVAEGTDGAIAIKQDDGSTKYFVVQFKTVTPAVFSVKASGPTTKGGKKNDPELHMPAKGKSGAAPLTKSKK